MNDKIIGGIAVLALVVGGFAFFQSDKITTVIREDGTVVGASSGPSIIDGCMDVNGTQVCAVTKAFSAASTTCSFPIRLASSTLVRATARATNLQGDTLFVGWGKAQNAFSTTTGLGEAVGVTGGTFVASSTPQGTYTPSSKNPASHFTAGDFLNFKVGSTSFSGTGVCSVLYMSI